MTGQPIVSPEHWYIAFWCALTLAVCAFGWFAGPYIIARGLELWMREMKE